MTEETETNHDGKTGGCMSNFDNKDLAESLRAMADVIERTRYPVTANLLLVDWKTSLLAEETRCEPIRVDGWYLDAARCMLGHDNGTQTKLNRKSATILYILMCNPDIAVPTRMLAQAIYVVPDGQGREKTAVATAVRSISRAITQVNPNIASPLSSVANVGYRFETLEVP